MNLNAPKFWQDKNFISFFLSPLSLITHLINFSIDPKIYFKEYNSTNHIDEKICNLIKNKNLIYIFPSSRLIYKKKKFNK